VIHIDTPYFLLLFPYLRPKLVCLKTVIVRKFRFYPVFCRSEHF
jgi:hypothetical protein